MALLRHWAPTIIAFGGVAAVAIIGGLLTRLGPWYEALRKPPWQPPGWLFAPAWTTIFILEAISAIRAWHAVAGTAAAGLLIAAYVLNGLFNMGWSLLFFFLRRPDLAFWETGFLWLSILAMIAVVAANAGSNWLFLLPYLLWVSFAWYLNHVIVQLNAPFRMAA